MCRLQRDTSPFSPPLLGCRSTSSSRRRSQLFPPVIPYRDFPPTQSLRVVPPPGQDSSSFQPHPIPQFFSLLQSPLVEYSYLPQYFPLVLLGSDDLFGILTIVPTHTTPPFSVRSVFFSFSGAHTDLRPCQLAPRPTTSFCHSCCFCPHVPRGCITQFPSGTFSVSAGDLVSPLVTFTRSDVRCCGPTRSY